MYVYLNFATDLRRFRSIVSVLAVFLRARLPDSPSETIVHSGSPMRTRKFSKRTKTHKQINMKARHSD